MGGKWEIYETNNKKKIRKLTLLNRPSVFLQPDSAFSASIALVAASNFLLKAFTAWGRGIKIEFERSGSGVKTKKEQKWKLYEIKKNNKKIIIILVKNLKGSKQLQ